MDLAALTCSSNGYASMYSAMAPFSKTTLDINKLFVSSSMTSKISDEAEGKSERAEEPAVAKQGKSIMQENVFIVYNKEVWVYLTFCAAIQHDFDIFDMWLLSKSSS